MRWRGGRESERIEDRRGIGFGSLGGPKFAVGGGVGTLLMAMVMYLLSGENAPDIIHHTIQVNQEGQTGRATYDSEAEAQFVKVVLGYTEEVWHKVFRQQLKINYVEPTLVLFSLTTQSDCGFASSQTGPFYCPQDDKIYIDLSFYRDLQEKLKAPGDFAMAYVIAHEVGHHVQNILGVTKYVHQQKGHLSEEDYNKLSVRLELQADFLAGVWAHHTQQMKNILEEGDVEEAMNAAHAIGDDRLQAMTRGFIVPDSFTHGTSAQRVSWFRKGFESGDLKLGNTFKKLSED